MEICNYVDHTILYSYNHDANNVITKLAQNVSNPTAWFPEKYMKLNENKCHLITLGANKEKLI